MDDQIAELAGRLNATEDLDRRQVEAILRALGRDLTRTLVRRAERNANPMATFVTLAHREVPHEEWPRVFFSREARGEYSRVWQPPRPNTNPLPVTRQPKKDDDELEYWLGSLRKKRKP